MRKTDVVSLFDYLYWVNALLLDAAERLPSGAWTDPAVPTIRDLRSTLVHELDVEWSWRLNIQGRLTDDTGDRRPEDYPDVAALRAHWRRDEADMRAWLDSMTDADIEAEVGSGLSRDRRPRWQYLMHIVMHAAQQQSDAATILTVLGQSPGEIGYLEFLRAAAAPRDA